MYETKITTKLLSKVNSPQDIKHFSFPKLNELAEEVRETLICVCAKNGGHIGTNLGVVELTIALHYAFDSPKDKLVFDTTHQTYTHKLLTGKREKFDTICTPKGIPRFSVRSDNVHDCWGAGHASTGLSAAMGMAEARKRNKKQYEVVAIVGDGAMTGGMCFEAMNNIGYNQTDLLIVLNDNKMSISPNVGALYEYMKRLSMTSASDKPRREIGTIFEKLGIRYYGPVDGHDIEGLVQAFNELKHIRGPKLLHVLTEKGKGMQYMEKDKARWHEHAAFDIETGDPVKPKSPTLEGVAVQALIELAEKDDSIIGITAAMPSGTAMAKFGEKFPDRFYDVGIAEEHATTFAAGLACEGVKPFVCIYSPFLQRAFDQIMHDVSLQDLPVRFMVPKAAITGDGPTQGGILDLSYLRVIPNTVVMAPKDENELRHMIKTMQLYEKGPISVRYPKGNINSIPAEPLKEIPIGQAEVLREGKDVALIAIGSMVGDALKASDQLKGMGIEAAVVNARFAKPLDEKTIIHALKTCGKGITLEENTLVGGFGSAVLELLESRGLQDIHVTRIGAPDEYIGYDDPKNIKAGYGMNVESIVARAKEWVARTK
ncbi:MAG: 1-deoxy-D-xylulose-5-phosphate synthase [Candidatus Diapherotrites archaeon]|nr:1-deoxy-D-xylulose-5-phosphate synthase [Candidatus Diapherotrites archaeon]